MFGLVSQMRASVFHLGYAGLPIMGMLPVLVGRLVRPLLVEPGQLLLRRRFNPFGPGQPFQVLAVALARVPAHDAAHRGVGLQRRGVDGHGLALEDVRLLQQPLFDQRKAPPTAALPLHPRGSAGSGSPGVPGGILDCAPGTSLVLPEPRRGYRESELSCRSH